jgi:hypothetical protein
MRHLLTVGLSGTMVGSALMVSSVFGASAATLNTVDFPSTNFSLVSDTPTLLDLKFNSLPYDLGFGSVFVSDDRFPLQFVAPGGVATTTPVNINGRDFVPVQKGPVVPILTSDNWTVSTQTLLFPGSKWFFALRSIIFQQTIPGGGNVPQGTLVLTRLPTFDSSSRKVSFFADDSPPDTQTCVSDFFPCSPATTFGTETCSAGSPNCVAFELKTISQAGQSSFGGVDFELLGFFTPPDSPKPVPEPAMGIGALTALGMMLLIRSRKFLSTEHSK